MPYEYTDVNLECDIFCCRENFMGECLCDEDISLLTEDSLKCAFFDFNPLKEFNLNDNIKGMIPSIIDNYKELGIPYIELETDVSRVVLKTVNHKSALFRVSKEEESNYYFFSAVEGHVEAIHNSIKEANIFTRKE